MSCHGYQWGFTLRPTWVLVLEIGKSLLKFLMVFFGRLGSMLPYTGNNSVLPEFIICCQPTIWLSKIRRVENALLCELINYTTLCSRLFTTSWVRISPRVPLRLVRFVVSFVSPGIWRHQARSGVDCDRRSASVHAVSSFPRINNPRPLFS
jgi:hypothetical protein